MSIILKSGDSGELAHVSAAGELAVGLAANPVAAGFVKLASPTGTPVAVAGTGYLFTGQDTLMFSDQIDGVVVNTNLWNPVNATLTTVQANGYIQLNASSLTTANGAAQLTSVKQFSANGGHPLVVEFTATVNVGPQTNAMMEFGIGVASGVTAPTDGVFLRYSANGNLVGVMSYGGVETYTDPIPLPDLNAAHEYIVMIDNDTATFVIDRVSVYKVAKPTAQPFPTSATRMPIFARVYNGTSAPATAPKLQIGQVVVAQTILNMNRDWAKTLASMGRGCYQSPLTTFGQTANFVNSTAPVTAAVANLTASYATLGGKFAFAAPAGAVTDYNLFAFQVPAGYQLFITRIDINCVNTGADVATTATILDWGVGINSSGVSLAVTDGVGTWAPRRRAMGQQGWVVGDKVGKTGDQLTSVYDPPMVVDSGRYFHVIVTVPVGTATASQILRGSVSVNGYFE